MTVTVDTSAKSYTIADRGAGHGLQETVKLGSNVGIPVDPTHQTAQVIVLPNGTTSTSSTAFTLGVKGVHQDGDDLGSPA